MVKQKTNAYLNPIQSPLNSHAYIIIFEFRSPLSMRILAPPKFPASSFFSLLKVRYSTIMAHSATGKKLIRIDVSSDTVCPWCFIGKKNLDRAVASSKDRFDFEIKWHPFFLDPSAPKEGVNKLEYYRSRFGSRFEGAMARMTEIFRGFGLEYNLSGLTGNSLDSHRLIYFAGQQGSDKQHKLVEEILLGYFVHAKYVGDREFLIECATKAGVEGAAEFLQDPNNGVKEVMEDLEKSSANISGVPYYVINGKHKLSGGQPSEVFLKAFEAASV